MPKKHLSPRLVVPRTDSWCNDRDEQVRFSMFCIFLEAAKTWQRMADRGGFISSERMPIGTTPARTKWQARNGRTRHRPAHARRTRTYRAPGPP